MSAPSGIFRGSGFPKGGIVPQKKPRGFSVSSHTRRGAHSGKTWVEKTWGRSPRLLDDVQSDFVDRLAASIMPWAAHGNEVNVPGF